MCTWLILKDDFRFDRKGEHSVNEIYLWGTLIKLRGDKYFKENQDKSQAQHYAKC